MFSCIYVRVKVCFICNLLFIYLPRSPLSVTADHSIVNYFVASSFCRLKQFIIDASSFQFITALTTIPELPDVSTYYEIDLMGRSSKMAGTMRFKNMAAVP